MRTAPKYLSGSSLLVEANTMVPSSSRTLSLEAWPLWMPAGLRRLPCAAAVLRFACPQLVPAVAPGGEVHLGVQKFCEQENDLPLFVFEKHRVMAAITDVTAHGLRVRPSFAPGYSTDTQSLASAAHGVAVPLQKATVPYGQQIAVVRQRQAGHMIALALVELLDDPLSVYDLCLHHISPF